MQRRRQDQATDAVRTPRRIFKRDQAAIRHAQDHGVLETGAIDRQIDLLDVIVEALFRIARESTGALVTKGERDHAIMLRQCVHGRAHPFPAALQARNQHNRRAGSLIDDAVHLSSATACRS
jgi:hypothetical protein